MKLREEEVLEMLVIQCLNIQNLVYGMQNNFASCFVKGIKREL